MKQNKIVGRGSRKTRLPVLIRATGLQGLERCGLRSPTFQAQPCHLLTEGLCKVMYLPEPLFVHRVGPHRVRVSDEPTELPGRVAATESSTRSAEHGPWDTAAAVSIRDYF